MVKTIAKNNNIGIMRAYTFNSLLLLPI